LLQQIFPATEQQLQRQERLQQAQRTLDCIIEGTSSSDPSGTFDPSTPFTPGVWVCVMLFYPVPKRIRDFVYDLGWKYRKRLFGTCACQSLPAECNVDPSTLKHALRTRNPYPT
jgi:predicted DCC family thiol-disulfide oxidoreductase YuxK